MTDTPDPDAIPDSGDSSGGESSTLQQLRRSQEATARENRELKAQLRDYVAVDAGFDLSNPLHANAWSNYDGKLEAEAVKEFASSLGISPSQSPQPPTTPAPEPAQPDPGALTEEQLIEAGVPPEVLGELTGIEEAMATPGGGSAQPTLIDKINSAQSVEDVLAQLPPEMIATD